TVHYSAALPTSPHATRHPLFLSILPPPPTPPLFPSTPLSRSLSIISTMSAPSSSRSPRPPPRAAARAPCAASPATPTAGRNPPRSEEHTSELQSLTNIVCRLLLEKKNRREADCAPSLTICHMS